MPVMQTQRRYGKRSDVYRDTIGFLMLVSGLGGMFLFASIPGPDDPPAVASREAAIGKIAFGIALFGGLMFVLGGLASAWLDKELGERSSPIGFRYQAKRALVTDRYKLLTGNLAGGKFELYDLIADAKESRDLSQEKPEVFASMKQQLLAWNASVNTSFAGKDYAEGRLSPPDPEPVNWYDLPQYQPHLADWKQRWEFKGYLNGAKGKAKQTGNGTRNGT